MKKIIKTIALVVGAAILFGFAGCKKVEKSGDNSLADLKSRGKFILGLDASFPPMGYVNDANEIVGYDIDLAKEVAKRMGVDFVAQPIDWDAKEMELKTGKIDCIWNAPPDVIETFASKRAALMRLVQEAILHEK